MRDLIDAAPHVDPDEHHTLAPADEADGKAEDLGTFDPATVTEEAPVRLQRALEAERAVRGFDAASPPPTEPASALRIRPR